ncbi:Retrovirus-related Pol polyprotein from transposon 17.6, partial [Araneus ventricosus]
MKINDERHGSIPVTCAASKKLISDMLISSTTYDALCKKIEAHAFSDKVDSEQPVPEEQNQKEKSSQEEKNDFGKSQREDDSLKAVWALGSSQQGGYSIEDGILLHTEWICGERVQQIVLPKSKREYVLRMAHELPLAGHLGEQKTKQRIKYSFFWPGIKKDVKEFCQTCKQCQVRRAITYRDRIPIQPVVRPENPFEVWSVDCIGPLEPPSRRGHRFVICAVDTCTRWAEAIPVKKITAKTTCDVLMKIFTTTGFPEVICTDQGTNFTALLTKEFLKLIGAAPRFATPGHPESMGTVERWNKTLKEMLNKNIQDHGRDWDLHLPYLLFAYREVPHGTTGLSPFQLVYGRLPRGPLALMRDFWMGKRNIPLGVSKSIEKYLEDLRQNLEKAHDIATGNAEKNQADYTRRYNLRAREKSFQVGEKVLILDSVSPHKLLKKWIGPVTIIALTRPHSVLVRMEDGATKETHVNKIRPYLARVEQVGVIYDQDGDFGEIFPAPADNDCEVNCDIQGRIYEQGKELSSQQKVELVHILSNYSHAFSRTPGKAKVPGHSIKVTDDCIPKRSAPYRIPVALQEEVERQIHELLEMGLIEHSDSDWAHPVVCVAKKNGNIRLCVDYRQLNQFTIPDAYPMKLITELLYEVGKARFISILDLTKGYWQIPMKPEAKHYTAFVTHSGLYQWNVMPFGMKNAGSTFQRSMDKILSKHRRYCRAYIDDAAIFSENWEEHKKHIREVFQTLQDSNLTVNLEKCEFGKKEVKFLGHVVGSGRHSPDPEKIETIKRLSQPTTKKEVRSLLGLANYYRDYIPNFSSLLLPLTDLTKKNIPNKIPWNEEAELAFQALKRELTRMPSLYTPQLDKSFQLYTDASATAIGACLAQTGDDGNEKPIAFFSKKLTPTQMRWATIEREAYAVLEALKKYDTWIFGARIQVISDHNPLTYLTQQTPHSAKLTRWSLALQRYDVTISYRKGSMHGNADSLSRLPV